MTSTLTLFKNCLIEPDKNFIIDLNGKKATEVYLNTLEKEVITNFQYIKHDLTLTIKINKNQSSLMMGEDSQDVNYCKIQNGEQNPCFYFIIKKHWKSENAIELVLNMDTLNSFRYDIDYVVSPKTLVKRMHKDRFKEDEGQTIIFEIQGVANNTVEKDIYDIRENVGNATLSGFYVEPADGTGIRPSIEEDSRGVKYIHLEIDTVASTLYTIEFTIRSTGLIAKIDHKSEDIVVPTYKVNERTIYESKNGIRNDWALYYKSNQNNQNLVDCYLVPEQALTIKYQGSNSVISTGNVPSNKFTIFSATYPAGVLAFKYDDTTVSLYANASGTSKTQTLVAFLNYNNQIEMYVATFIKTTNSSYGNWQRVYIGNVDVVNAPEYIYGYAVNSLPSSFDWFNDNMDDPNNATTSIQFSALVSAILDGHDSIDKTLAENIKIINLPYSPTPYTIGASNVYAFAPCWTYNTSDKRLILNDFNAKWDNEIDSHILNLISPYIKDITGINLHNDINRTFKDPKLYHSDYYRQKFVYDSFSKIFPLEKISYDESSKDADFKFDFIMSRNIVSKFLFKFNQFKYTLSNEDYDNIVAVSRNNEEVLYNSQYINYIRTGYNYDLKAKERNEVASGIGIGLNVASLLASVGLSFVPGGQAIGVAGGVASAIGLAGQIVNYAKTNAQNEENIQRKLQESLQQGTSVMNADDYDLLYSYSENKAKYCLYTASPQMQDILDDLFFYCGYVVNEQMKPDVNSRRSFNFVQASLVIDSTANLSNDIIEDIKARFDEGVTFLHYSHGKWDFDQDKENIERSLL